MDDPTTGQEQQVEETTTQVMPDQTKPADAQTEPSQPDQLPEDASERTRREFEKLKEHNKQLAEKLAAIERTQTPSVLDSLIPQDTYQPQAAQYQNLSQQQVDQIASTFVDKDGFVDISAVEQALKKANHETAEASKRVQNLEQRVTRYEHDAQTQKAHSAHPYLDPANSQFDPKFYNLVKNELIGQMMVGEQDLLKAANKVKNDLYDPSGKSQAGEQKKQQTVAQRTQATANPILSKDFTSQEHADLVVGTMKGDNNALYKRLKASGY